MNRRITRDLPVRLTREESELYGKLQAEKHRAANALAEKKKAISQDYGGQIASLKNEQDRLAEAISKGEELRPVECEERYAGNVVEIYRLDTGERVDSRPATIADRQVGFPGLDDDDPDPEDDDEPRTYEGRVVASSAGDEVYIGGSLKPGPESLAAQEAAAEAAEQAPSGKRRAKR